MSDELMEALADAEHDSWARWMKYLFDLSERRADGTVVIPAGLVHRWTRQADTPYTNLTELEKESDRAEVRKILPLIRVDRIAR